MIRKNRDKIKYNLLDMIMDEYQDFSIKDYNRVRSACSSTGAKYDRKFTTRKMKYKNGKVFIRVYRIR
jgi:hypothetical protein